MSAPTTTEKTTTTTDIEKAPSSPIHDEKRDSSSLDDDLVDGNAIVEGSEDVTYHELETLRHVPDSLPISAWLIIIVEFAERWSYYGVSNLLGNYIRYPLPPGSIDGHVVFDKLNGRTGALNQGVSTTFGIRTFNSFWSYVSPLMGGAIADTVWGRYKTIWVFSIVCVIGHIILTGSAAPSVLAKPQTALGLLILSIIIIGTGAGGIKANVSPMIAEQYTGKIHKVTLKSGEVVIKTPALTYQRIYLWFYAAINLGSTGSISGSFMARDHGWWVAFLVPTLIFCIVPFVLYLGKKNYVTTPPRGSILFETARVIRLCLAPVWSLNPVTTIRGIKKEGFWDTAKPSHYPVGQVPDAITWDDEFVGEVDRTVNACAVFLFFPFFWLCYSQIDNNLTQVAAGMKLNGTPNDVIQNLNPIAIVVLIPIFDKGIYPFLRKIGVNFSPIKRIYAGFLVVGLGMVYAAVLEQFLYERSPCQPDHQPSACVKVSDDPEVNGQPNPVNLSVWVVAGPFILVGIGEILANVTSLEYAFTKAPLRMKSVVTSFNLLQSAISSAINFALVPVNIEVDYVWLFSSFAITVWIIGTIFMIVFRPLDKRDFALTIIGTGERVGFKGEEGKAQKLAAGNLTSIFHTPKITDGGAPA